MGEYETLLQDTRNFLRAAEYEGIPRLRIIASQRLTKIPQLYKYCFLSIFRALRPDSSLFKMNEA